MFALLDSKTGITIISDLILSFLPLRFVDYTTDDISRIYRNTSGIGGLSEPFLIFSETVWADRLCNPDSPNGIRLHALRVLGDPEKPETIGRPFPNRQAIFCDILTNIQHPSHSLCNSAIRKLISAKQENVTDQEYEYLNNHFCGQLLNNFYSYLNGSDTYEIIQSGIGDFLAHLIDMVGKNDRCSEIRVDLVEWIVSKLDEDRNIFTKFIFSPNYEKFENIFSNLDPNTSDPELLEKFRLYLVRDNKLSRIIGPGH